MCGAISEGGTIYLHSMKFVPLEDLGIRELKVLKYHKLAMEAPFSYLILGDASELSDHRLKRKKKKKKKKPLRHRQNKSCPL